MDFTFKNKVIVVTGGGGGIGREVCKTLYKCGAKVVALCMDENGLASLAKECPGINTITLNVAKDWNATRAAVEGIGHIDGLVNNAGVSYTAPFIDTTPEGYDKCFDVNVKAVLNISQGAVRQMLKQGTGGSIVNLSSIASQAAEPEHVVYCATKGALDAMTRVMALELGKDNIRVNCVNPTVVMTAMGRKAWSDPAKASFMLNKIPLNRFAEPQEVVNAIVFLLSDKASMITGTTLPVDGGFLAC